MKVMLLVGAPRCGKTQLALQMCENKRIVFFMMSDHQVLKVSWNILIQMLM